MTWLVENLLPLAPTLLALVGALVVGAVDRLGRAAGTPLDRRGSVLVSVGEGFLALALGATIRLAIGWLQKPGETFDPFGAMTAAAPGLAAKTYLSFPGILGVARLDPLALLASALVLSLAIGTVIAASAASPRTMVGILFATAAMLYAIVSPAPVALGIGWFALALAPLVDARPREAARDESAADVSPAASWLLFGVSAAAICFFADAALEVSGGALLGDRSAPRGVPALLILLAVSAAGIGPLGGIVRKLAEADAAPVGRFVARALPSLGFLLAARVLIGSPAAVNPTAPTLLLRGFLIVLVLWSVGEALAGRLTREERLARGLIALAFLVLATLSVSLVFLGFGVLALGAVTAMTGETLFGSDRQRNALVGLPYLGLTEWRDELAIPDALSDGVRDLALLLQQIEERYDLAAGLLLALAVASAFAR